MTQLVGIVGLLAIIIGVLVRHRSERDYLYLLGGVLLAIYSWSIGDEIFLTLQIVFTLAAAYDLWKSRKKPR